MRYFAAINLSQHGFSIQHFVRTKPVRDTIALALLVFPLSLLTPNPAQAATRVCNAGNAEILIAYMWPDGRLGSGDLDYIKVEGWHALRPGQCEKNEGSLRVAVAQLDGQGNWGFPNYTFDGPSDVWRLYNNSNYRACVGPPGKRFSYGPGPSREPCPNGFVETTFPLGARENGNNLFPGTASIKTTEIPKLYSLENEPVASPSQSRLPQLFGEKSPAKPAPDSDKAKLNNFILEIIISRTIPLLCPDNYSLDGAATPGDRAKALGIDNYQASVAGSVSAVLLLLDPKYADNPILKAAATPEITKTAGWVTSVGKMLVEQHSCSNPVFLSLAEPSHLYQAKAGKR